MRKLLHKLVLMLDRPGGRWLISMSLPLIGRRSAEGVRSLHYDNGWVHRFALGVVVEPEPRMRSRHLGEERNTLTWGYLYTPKRGDTVIDVGAGLGAESLFYAGRVGPAGRVVAIEAHPRICEFLKRTMELNDFRQVTVLNVAVADKPQTVIIEDDMEHHLGNAIQVGAPGSGVTVSALPLDQICRMHKVDQIDFLKMNIEGAEQLALPGMVNIIRNTRFVSISCHDFKFRRTGNEFFKTKSLVEQYFRDHGFHIVPRQSEDQALADQVNAYNTSLVSSGEAGSFPSVQPGAHDIAA